MPRTIIALIALWLVPLSLSAAEVELYQASGAIASQSEEDRRKKAPELLRDVVIKIVGNEQTVENADISALLDSPDQYIQQYSYERLNPDASNTEPDKLALKLTFNQNTLLDAIERLNLPIWEENRPEMLIWVAVDDGGDRELLSGDDKDFSLVERIKTTAQRRGLPVIFPVMDLEDQTQLTFGDVWSGSTSNIRNASERYGSQIIVAARVTVSNDENAQIRWQALMADDEERWQSTGEPQKAVEKGIDQLADLLGQQFAQRYSGQSQQQLKLMVEGIKGFKDYQRVVDYLTRLQAVEHVDISELRGDSLAVDVFLRGDEQAFERTLAYGQVLKAISADGATNRRFELLP